MPLYTHLCLNCGNEFEVLSSIGERDMLTLCHCGAPTKRIPAVARVDIFTPYYDEALNSDIYSRRDKRHIMEQLGVEEAGDKTHGGRNLDKHALDYIKPQELQGVRRPAVRE